MSLNDFIVFLYILYPGKSSYLRRFFNFLRIFFIFLSLRKGRIKKMCFSFFFIFLVLVFCVSDVVLSMRKMRISFLEIFLKKFRSVASCKH